MKRQLQRLKKMLRNVDDSIVSERDEVMNDEGESGEAMLVPELKNSKLDAATWELMGGCMTVEILEATARVAKRLKRLRLQRHCQHKECSSRWLKPRRFPDSELCRRSIPRRSLSILIWCLLRLISTMILGYGESTVMM